MTLTLTLTLTQAAEDEEMGDDLGMVEDTTSSDDE